MTITTAAHPLDRELGERIPGVRRMAVLRANALGDFVVTLPALEALRAAYPDAEIVLLGRRMHVELLDRRPSPVDRVELVPPTRGINEPGPGEREDPGQVDAFVERMRAQRFDVAVQLHGGGRWSNPLVNRLGARTTVGLRAPDAAALDRWAPYVYYQHEVLRFLEVVALTGAPPVSLRPRLAVVPTDRASADAVLDGLPDPIVAVHPGANDARRRWPVERFAAVADALAEAGAQVVLTGSGDECRLTASVAALMRRPACNVCGRLDLPGLVGLLDRAVLVVSNDTGPRHVAEAVGTATVSIYWCGNLVNVGPLWRARHRPHISWRLQCPVCGAGTMSDLYPARDGQTSCSHPASFVADVPLVEVLCDALELFHTEVERAGERRMSSSKTKS